ncbi:MAG: hypothetical protein ACLR2G_06390 [Phascolarctobacterium faecium]
MISILQKLQFEVHEEGEDLVVTAPSWRYDVTCDADISERSRVCIRMTRLPHICLLCLWYRGVRM